MSTARTAPELVRSLEREQLRFRSFSLSSSGSWTAEDADWNYKDIPHLNIVHTQARSVQAVIQDELCATVNLQKVAGIWSPIALVNYVAHDGSQVYYTTMFCFVLVVETKITPELRGARVDTTYHIGGPRWAMRTFPLIRKVLTANYRVLMSEDIPMRDQRARLREVGYTFASDGRARTYAETADLTVKNVSAPSTPPEVVCGAEVADLGGEGASVVAGSGPDGLRFVRSKNGEVLVFDRVCPHEGASLDCAQLRDGVLVCPWHGKRVKPVATFSVDEAPIGPTAVGTRHTMRVEVEPGAVEDRPEITANTEQSGRRASA